MADETLNETTKTTEGQTPPSKDAPSGSSAPKNKLNKRKKLALKIPLYIIIGGFAIAGFVTAVQSIVEGVSFTDQLAANVMQSFEGAQNSAIARAFAGTDAIRNAGGILPEDDEEKKDDKSNSSSSSSSDSNSGSNDNNSRTNRNSGSATGDSGRSTVTNSGSGSGSGSVSGSVSGGGGGGTETTTTQQQPATSTTTTTTTDPAPQPQPQTQTETVQHTTTESTPVEQTSTPTESQVVTHEEPVVYHYEETLDPQVVTEQPSPAVVNSHTVTEQPESTQGNTQESTQSTPQGGEYIIQYVLAQEAVMGVGANPYLGSVIAPVGQSVRLFTLADTGWEPYANRAGQQLVGWSLDYGASAPNFQLGDMLGTGLTHPDGALAQAGDTIYLYGVWRAA